MSFRRKIILLTSLLVLCSLALVLFIAAQLSVTCEVDSEIWAINPRTTVDNVILYDASSGNKFSLKGIYTDITGESWYVVSGVLKYDPHAGLDRGFILKSNCRLSLG